jgi:hypothetical protein
MLVVQKSQLKATGMTDCLEWGRESGASVGFWVFFFDFSFLGFLFQGRETRSERLRFHQVFPYSPC